MYVCRYACMHVGLQESQQPGLFSAGFLTCDGTCSPERKSTLSWPVCTVFFQRDPWRRKLLERLQHTISPMQSPTIGTEGKGPCCEHLLAIMPRVTTAWVQIQGLRAAHRTEPPQNQSRAHEKAHWRATYIHTPEQFL